MHPQFFHPPPNFIPPHPANFTYPRTLQFSHPAPCTLQFSIQILAKNQKLNVTCVCSILSANLSTPE